MPLVNDLHNKAMRDRHWSQIKVLNRLNNQKPLVNKKNNLIF